MSINDLPGLAALRTRMQWHQERQRVLAENVANSDTPNFRPRDLVEPKFDRSGVAAVESAFAMFSEITRIRPACARRPEVAMPIDRAKSAIT